MQIGVIGSNRCSEEIVKIATDVGREIARSGATLVCGGMEGVMEAAARGAKEEGGRTIGILPGFNKKQANKYIDFFIVTGMGEGRNVIVVKSSDAIIAIAGGSGTLSEIAFALNASIPVVGLNTWDLRISGRKPEGIIRARSAKDAVKKALTMIK
ncbi:TIGR00725 family protein [candidate division NPL-UPA2 bacterium Unc8]|uniref:TIGR00725 family protein n=1 Tax=candidate division NPL-UPA2 bacterium Unc8 TaxID=1980939 RepID=A0A399FWZ3_UNCN2|nr:Cytokinin riboside 5'-monophosphate phosphoribohydrolase [Bacillota bacterium]MBT9137606.1 Cytokinin riboside 5'-monophosphate phosphoribohydrolase [Bacillota bacterium]MBT9146328.1 Cytokinin riboside 5'-monophosphate phosphoribohydrolase [Bacillota bacterium]RII00691.1 MAG: TIGR00725 family protein [candidate division NPL-UPA2 bacterium Unc8]